MTKKNRSIEERIEALEYAVQKFHGLTPGALATQRADDMARWKAQAAAEKEKDAARARERRRKEAIIERYKRNPPKCPECRSPSKFFEATGETGQFMDGPLEGGLYWWCEFDCLNEEEHHRHRFKVYPDAPDESKDIVIDPKDIAIEEEEE